MVYKRHIYSDEQIVDAVSRSKNWREVCEILGINPMSGSQTNMAKRAKSINVNYSHFTGPTRFSREKRPLEDYLLNRARINSSSLKKKLIAAGMKEDRCEKCYGVEWFGDPMPLELDHKNGNHWDNSIENLEILCPNCHAIKTRKQALGEGAIPHYRKPKITYEPRKCGCGRNISYKSKTCIFCRPKGNQKTKIQWPAEDIIRERIAASSVLALSKDLGVSDNAIRKHLHRIAKRRSGVAATHLISGFDARPVLQVI